MLLISNSNPNSHYHIMIEVVAVKDTIIPVLNMVAIYKMKSFIFAADPIVSENLLCSPVNAFLSAVARIGELNSVHAAFLFDHMESNPRSKQST